MSFARVRALVVIGVLAVAAVVFVVVALVRDSQSDAATGVSCPPGSVMADVRLPEPKEVKIRVFNATSTAGLADNVTNDFKNRKFLTQKPRDNNKVVDKVAVLRFGPQAVGDAQLLRAYFLDEADTEYDAKRKGDVVDVIIGSQFRQLATTTEVNQALVELGEPEVPPGACPQPVKKAAGR
ncbi:MAG TPA: LytR C-terminal domain-containing protein [Actinoplanes sp.]|jgi:hypothetical protein